MTTRTGPVTKDATAVALGLAQIRVALATTYIGQIAQILPVANSLGAMASTKYMGSAEFYKLESGFPLLEDAVFPLRTACSLECAFREITPYNLAISLGKDPTSFTDAHKGKIGLGSLVSPVYLRMEAIYTFPDGVNKMIVIFPRCQAVSSQELDWQSEEPAAVSMTLEAKRADSGISGGHVIWDDKPLGLIYFDDGTVTTTSSTTTTTAP